ncbi:hypothetical protein D3C85_1128300 [compost metagenome]
MVPSSWFDSFTVANVTSLPSIAVASSLFPAALAFCISVLSAAVRVAAEMVTMLAPPSIWLRVLAPLRAAASTAFCRRVLFNNMWLTSRAKPATMKIAAKANTINTLTDPSWRLGVEVNGR